MTTEALLDERGKTHGDYNEQASMAQAIKMTFRDGKNWRMLTDVQADALEMIAVKLSRILTGNPDEPDHWLDIAGYATLPTKFSAPTANVKPIKQTPDKISPHNGNGGEYHADRDVLGKPYGDLHSGKHD